MGKEWRDLIFGIMRILGPARVMDATEQELDAGVPAKSLWKRLWEEMRSAIWKHLLSRDRGYILPSRVITLRKILLHPGWTIGLCVSPGPPPSWGLRGFMTISLRPRSAYISSSNSGLRKHGFVCLSPTVALFYPFPVYPSIFKYLGQNMLFRLEIRT